ncbi:MAG TPA: hypothetical protein VFA77_13575 [Candidatus Eisenbacteria bacterium]|jgi:anti-sigma factor RsiW|nr:hypothetical protein [Candidatus Eisenbacteria bacterium]
MIDQETQLKLQAYLDGESTSREAGEIVRLLDSDAEAQVLFNELRATKSLLAGNEPERKLAEPREFYWSRIRREIERAERSADLLSAPATTTWWLRVFAPASLLAVLGVFVAVSLRSPENSVPMLAFGEGHEIDTPLEEISSFTFRSERAGMTVVWVDSHRN